MSLYKGLPIAKKAGDATTGSTTSGDRKTDGPSDRAASAFSRKKPLATSSKSSLPLGSSVARPPVMTSQRSTAETSNAPATTTITASATATTLFAESQMSGAAPFTLQTGTHSASIHPSPPAASSSKPPPAKGKARPAGHDPLSNLDREYHLLAPNHYDRCRAALDRQREEAEAERERRRREVREERQQRRREAKRGKRRSTTDPASQVDASADTETEARIVDVKQTEVVSPVIILCNMVNPGEVDPDLQQETSEECQKYGPVTKCLVYEAPAGQLPAEEAVRIFVEFADVAAADRARRDLHGRFFGGRRVTARLFDLDRFMRYDLAPTPEELRLGS
ncbi:hypothetical protein IWQ60_002569 [Tieghemiomyces parasiticus]|uniref:RNA recognition motif domain-containing protein n=1 Tax=Tieghemiomyces parasiticus TaxID=78921 RepID=A0A9W8AEL3_9FUNG|nr:hypothetical protein IWQ60_002569 [Tieghemiomyces parasiticus]